MKRLQVLLPDDVYESLRKEVARRQTTVADFVRRGIDRQLQSAVDAPFKKPTLTPVNLGEPMIPVERLREVANER